MPGRLLHDPAKNQSLGAGWSSPVARQAHNLKVVGSNPTPATITNCLAASPASVDRQPAISGIDLRMLAAGGEDLVQLADLLTVDLGHTGSEVDLSRL